MDEVQEKQILLCVFHNVNHITIFVKTIESREHG